MKYIVLILFVFFCSCSDHITAPGYEQPKESVGYEKGHEINGQLYMQSVKFYVFSKRQEIIRTCWEMEQNDETKWHTNTPVYFDSLVFTYFISDSTLYLLKNEKEYKASIVRSGFNNSNLSIKVETDDFEINGRKIDSWFLFKMVL